MRFPGESDEYRQARDALLQAEADLRDRTEAVAEQRRQLPLGGTVPLDYEFLECDTATGSPRPVRLSDLFAGGKDTLFLYSFMFIAGPDGNPIGSPCPNCTSIIDAVAGQAPHFDAGDQLCCLCEGADRVLPGPRLQPGLGRCPPALLIREQLQPGLRGRGHPGPAMADCNGVR